MVHSSVGTIQFGSSQQNSTSGSSYESNARSSGRRDTVAPFRSPLWSHLIIIVLWREAVSRLSAEYLYGTFRGDRY